MKVSIFDIINFIPWMVIPMKELTENQSAPFSFPTDDQRMISIPSSALGKLRKELIETLGIDWAKGFLLRYGWNCGASDGEKMKELKWENELDLLYAGPKMHSYHGHVQVEILSSHLDIQKGTVYLEGNWFNSYEAEEHLKLFGKSENPICHSLVGYASGYLSTIMGKKVITKETECIAKGDERCHWVCKTVEEWYKEENIEKELTYYEAQHIGDELNETYEKLRIERDSLSKTHQIHRKLVKEVLNETGLKSIANVLYQTLGIPVIIEDLKCNHYAAAGFSLQEAKRYSAEFKKWLNAPEHKKSCESTKDKQSLYLELSSNHKRLYTPIYIQQNIFGYCSFLYNERTVKEVEKMVLVHAALACSLHLMNERTRFNTEQQMRGNFLEDIINNRISNSEVIKRAHFVDFQLNEPYFMVAIHRRFEEQSIKDEVEYNDQFMKELHTYFKEKQIEGLLTQKLDNVIILFSESTIYKNKLNKEDFCKQIIEYCMNLYPKSSFRLGISSSFPTIEDASNLYDESLAALKVCNVHQPLVYFDSLGIVGMLLQTENLDMIEKFAYKILGNLIKEDKNKNMELTKTLYYYLENGSNVHKTARAMNFSISGLRYRLSRINEILKKDINMPSIRHEIYLALQSLIVLEELVIN